MIQNSSATSTSFNARFVAGVNRGARSTCMICKHSNVRLVQGHVVPLPANDVEIVANEVVVAQTTLGSEVREHRESWIVPDAEVRTETKKKRRKTRQKPAPGSHRRSFWGTLGHHGRRDDGHEGKIAPDHSWSPHAVRRIFEGRLTNGQVARHELRPNT